MVSRHFLRIKTMQALYAYNANPKAEPRTYEADLIKAIKGTYELFLWLFALLPEIAFYRMKKLESLKEKYNPTHEDLNPNTRFVDNRVIRQIEENKILKQLWPKYHILWEDEKDLIAKLFHEIELLPEYEAYMASTQNNYFEDKKIVLAIIEKVFANNDLLHWYLGEKNTHWIDDYEEAMLMFYQNVKEFKETKGDECRIDSLFKGEEDEKFCRELFRKTLDHASEYTQMIEGLQDAPLHYRTFRSRRKHCLEKYEAQQKAVSRYGHFHNRQRCRISDGILLCGLQPDIHKERLHRLSL